MDGGNGDEGGAVVGIFTLVNEGNENFTRGMGTRGMGTRGMFTRGMNG